MAIVDEKGRSQTSQWSLLKPSIFDHEGPKFPCLSKTFGTFFKEFSYLWIILTLKCYFFPIHCHATREMNSPRTFLFSFLVFKDFTKADLIFAFDASSSTSNSESDDKTLEEIPK